MRKSLVLIVGLAGALIMSACSSSEEPSKVKSTSATNSANANTVAVANGTEVQRPQPDDANAVTDTSSDQLGSAANKFDARVKAMRESGETGPAADPAVIAMKNARPAPDNSTFTSYLTDVGYEIRTFKNHPQLLKVEKKISADGNQAVKIYLRDGRVLDLPGQKITVLATASAAFILEAAGLKAQPTQKQAPAGPPATKKSGE